MTLKTRSAKNRAGRKQHKGRRLRRRAQSARRRSNARPRGRTPARYAPAARPARVAEDMPMAKRLDGFLVDIANAGFHKPALWHWRLDWATEIQPRITAGPKFDEEFAASYKSAKECGEQYRILLREENADMKAMEGWDEPVYQQGKFVGLIRRFSERLHELMLKAGNPGKFADRHRFGGENGEQLPGVVMIPAAVPAPRAVG